MNVLPYRLDVASIPGGIVEVNLLSPDGQQIARAAGNGLPDALVNLGLSFGGTIPIRR